MAVTHPLPATRNGLADYIVDQLDDGELQIYDSDETTLLAILSLGTPAFGDASDGVATANAITSDASADATGDAAVAHFCDASGNIIFKCSVSEKGGGGDLELSSDSATITSGQEVSCQSFSYSAPN
jgi:hypothetical protein